MEQLPRTWNTLYAPQGEPCLNNDENVYLTTMYVECRNVNKKIYCENRPREVVGVLWRRMYVLNVLSDCCCVYKCCSSTYNRLSRRAMVFREESEIMVITICIIIPDTKKLLLLAPIFYYQKLRVNINLG